eukprot:1139082-Pelagomonas_calceolata.AAC.1
MLVGGVQAPLGRKCAGARVFDKKSRLIDHHPCKAKVQLCIQLPIRPHQQQTSDRSTAAICHVAMPSAAGGAQPAPKGESMAMEDSADAPSAKYFKSSGWVEATQMVVPLCCVPDSGRSSNFSHLPSTRACILPASKEPTGQDWPRLFCTGKIHWKNTLEQLKLVGPQSLGVALLTAGFVGMVFTIQVCMTDGAQFRNTSLHQDEGKHVDGSMRSQCRVIQLIQNA